MDFKRLFRNRSEPPDEIAIDRPEVETVYGPIILFFIPLAVYLIATAVGSPSAPQPWFFPHIVVLWHVVWFARFLQITNLRCRRLYIDEHDGILMRGIYGPKHIPWDNLRIARITYAFDGCRFTLRGTKSTISFKVGGDGTPILQTIDECAPFAFILNFTNGRFFIPPYDTQTDIRPQLASMLRFGGAKAVVFAFLSFLAGLVLTIGGFFAIYNFSCHSIFVCWTVGPALFVVAFHQWSDARNAGAAIDLIHQGYGIVKRNPDGPTPGITSTPSLPISTTFPDT